MKKNTLSRLILLLAAMLLMAMSACAHPASQPAQQSSQPQADTVEVMSQAMGRYIKNVVIVPKQYYATEQTTEQFPVLYLLHGAYGSYRDWPHKANLDALASKYAVIIVCPDGQDSWYVDSPINPKMQFETYISKELVAYIDSHYRTFANRYMRAITGLSMGGHGALTLAWKHPDVFWSCGSMSGCMNLTKFPDKWHIKDFLGEYEQNKKLWEESSACYLVPKLKESPLKPAQNILIDDGTKDIFYYHNVAMHELLLENEIDHEFTVRPGAHSWDYWVNALDYHMVFFSKAFVHGARLMHDDENE